MGLSKFQVQDFKKYFKYKGDVGFSPEKNKAVIEQTIVDAEAEYAKRKKKFMGMVGERVDLIATYLKSPNGGQKNKSLEKYFGRKELARLRGMEILQELRERSMKKQFHRPLSASQALRKKI